MLRTAALIAAIALSLASTTGPPDPLEVDSCLNPSQLEASAVEIGPRGSGEFSPFAPGDMATLVRTDTGVLLLSVRFLVHGLDADCVTQSTTVRYCAPNDHFCDEGEGVSLPRPESLRTYAHRDSRVTADYPVLLTKEHFVGIGVGGELTVSTTVAGATDEVTLVIDELP